MSIESMTAGERRAVSGLAGLYVLRMLGLFMVLPVLSIYSADLEGATPALIGIAIGSGTDVAIESADIILIRSNPQDVVNIFELSRATYRKMIENLLWATGYNLFALPLAAGVLAPIGFVLSPAVGAAFMSVSTVVVAINAQLLRRTNLSAS